MSNGNDELKFKMKVAEWRGYVGKALESIEQNQKDICERLTRLETKMDERMDETEREVSDLKSKVSKLSGTISLIVSVAVSGIGFLLKKLFG